MNPDQMPRDDDEPEDAPTQMDYMELSCRIMENERRYEMKALRPPQERL